MKVFLDVCPHVNRNFIAHLCGEFEVIVARPLIDEVRRIHGPESLSGLDYTLLDEMVNLQPQDVINEAAEEIHSYFSYLESKIAEILPETRDFVFDAKQMSELKARSYGTLMSVYGFRKLIQEVDIDLVLVNSDWVPNRRAIVLEAKKNGIPTVNIEHGFYGLQPEASAFKIRPDLRFVSDFVSLDNQIEESIISGYYQREGIQEKIEFVVNGTPNDSGYDAGVTKEEAIKALGLEEGKFTVTLAAAWLPMMAASFAFRRQIEMVESYREVIKALSIFEDRARIQLVVKLHPKSSLTGSFRDEKNYLEKLGKDLGMPIALVTDQNLPEVLAATDLLVCFGLSSILWDGLNGNIPGIRFLEPGFVKSNFIKDKLTTSNPIFREGLMHDIFSGEELLKYLVYYMKGQNLDEFRSNCSNTRLSLGLVDSSIEAKCEWLSNWIRQNIPLRN